MLTDVTMLPSAFSPETHAEALSALLDVLDAGQLVIDDAAAVMTEIEGQLRQWGKPEQASKVRRVLVKLNQDKRVIRGSHRELKGDCSKGCRVGRGIAKSLKVAVVISGCSCGTSTAAGGIQADAYLGSVEQANIRKAVESLNGGQAIGDLERLVLAPLLKYAESLVLYDRYLGRTVLEEFRNGNGAAVGHHFDQSVRWVLDTYATVGLSANKSVRIVTGMFVGRGAVPREPVAVMERWRQDLAGAYRGRLAIGVDVRAEVSRALQLEKDRYLITNQAWVSVTRGLDMILTDDQMADYGIDPTTGRVVHPAVFTLMPTIRSVDDHLKGLKPLLRV